MGYSNFFMLVFLSSFVLHNYVVIAQENFLIGFTEDERNALLALKAGFHNAFLDEKWQSKNCYDWFGLKCNGTVVGVTLENLDISGEIKVDALYNLTALSILSFKNNLISGQLMDFSNNVNLAQLDLSSNNFSGPISPSLADLVLLESLQLQENRLTGQIPPFDQPSLKEFNVSNNNLSGPIPNTSILQSFDDSSYDHNLLLCGPPLSTICGPSSLVNDTSSSSNKSQIGHLLVIVNAVGLFILIILLFTVYKKKKQLDQKIIERENIAVKYDEEKGEEIPSELPSEIPSQVIDNKAKGTKQDQENLVFVDGVAEFELGDLMKASAESLGKGNFGNAYRVRLDDGRHVIVKRLRDLKPLSRDEFMSRLQVITAHRHPNLAPPIAYFYSKDEKLLVHKFTANGNLFNRIHGGRGTSDRIPFRWSARLAVAQGVARAMEYLHMNPNSQAAVPHGNLKSSNVLIDENNMVLVSDYGMTSIISNKISAQRMVSYRSPEYLASKKVSKKSDVWSYGSLVMELLTGKISSHSDPKDNTAVDLGSWVHRAVREEWTAEIFDLEIMVQRSAIHGMLKLLQLAVRCCDNSPVKRPEMSEVVREVESIKLPSVESESEEDLSADRSADRSVDRSLTDDSMSATPSR
ncbi:protein kinase-like domain-containing protein [Artemisia annua]|uniref:Protein kinase-like domain-containing protein n=1 Tax=Artemisia annua TaxID=35608 RepID=A0A2U1L5G8_ARTAN|nr:protein kinase-like domain-containing protein [Artemisia annua]